MTAATTTEKLFVSIFERKKSIIEEIKHQTEFFDHHLASKCLLEGIAPPPWLWSPSLSSDLTELKKEELISGLLLPRTQPSIPPNSSGCYPLFQKLIVSANDGALPNSLYSEVHASNKGIDADNRLSILPQFLGDGQHLVNRASEVGFASTSQPCRGVKKVSPNGDGLPNSLHSETHALNEGIDAANKLSALPPFLGDGLGTVNRVPEAGYTSASPQQCRAMESVSANDNGLQNSLYLEVDALNKGIDAANRLSALPLFLGDGLCTVNRVPEVGFTSASPQQRRGVGSDSQDHVQSLMKIQRSKSRQRALEVRNSAKTVKTCSHDEIITDTFTSQIKGSGVVSLHYDHADEAQLLEPIDANTKSHTGEAMKTCESERQEPGSSYKANEPRNVDHSSGINKGDGNKLTKQPLFFLDGNNSSLVVDANCAAEEMTTVGCRDNETGSNKCTSGLGRSRSSTWVPSSPKETLCTAKCLSNAKQDRSNSIDESAKQLSHVHSSQSAESSSTGYGKNNGAKKATHANNQSMEKESNIYCGRITRSRSSSHEHSFVNYNSSLGRSCGNVSKVSNDKPRKQTTFVGELKELTTQFDITNKTSRLKEKVSNSQRYEKGSDSNRAISCSQENSCGDECLKMDSPCACRYGNGLGRPEEQSNYINNLMALIEPFDITDKSCGVEGKVWDYRANREENDACDGKIKGSRSSIQQVGGVEEFPTVQNSFNIAGDGDGDGACAMSFGKSSQTPQPLLSVEEHALELQNESVTKENVLPFTECINTVDQERCDAVVAETDMKSAGLVEACYVSSGTNIEGASLGMEVLDSRTSAECAMLLKPKQLDFDCVEDCHLNGTSDSGLDNQQEDTSLEKQPSVMKYSEDISAKVISVDYQEKPASSVLMPLLEGEVVFGEDKTLRGSDGVYFENSATLVHERKINSAQQKINISILHNRVKDSWPQHKRMKIANQLINALPAPASSVTKPFQTVHTIHDAMQSKIEDKDQNLGQHILNKSISLSPKLHVEEAHLCLAGMDRIANASLMSDWPEASSFSGLTELVGGVSKADYISPALVNCVQYTDNKAPPQSENRSQLRSTEHLSSTEENTQERENCIIGNIDRTCSSVNSRSNQSQILISADEEMPELESFVMEEDDKLLCIDKKGINFENLSLPNSLIERASVVEQLCKSACLETPLSQFSTTYELHKTLSVYQSSTDVLLEGINVRCSPNANADIGVQLEGGYILNDEDSCAFRGSTSSDSLPSSGAPYAWDIKKPFVSPIRELWDAITSKSGSSEKRVSSIPDLPSIDEENENIDEVADTFQEDPVSKVMSGLVKREPLADITKSLNPALAICEDKILKDHCASSNKSGNGRKHINKENGSLSLGMIGVKKTTRSLNNTLSKPRLTGETSLRKGDSGVLERDSKRNNIVSNITSFVPLVQQKQADAVITGKREIRVKSLEVAEAAKRLAQKKENERKMRKEALKLERARIEKQNLRQLELEKEKKEEKKKKEADMAARKRHREEEEKKERERKRKRVEDARKQQLENVEKLRAEKELREQKTGAPEERMFGKKELKDKSQKHEKMGIAKGDKDSLKVPETEPKSFSTIDNREASIIVEDSALSDFGENSKVRSNSIEATEGSNVILNKIEEQSYDISPYKVSDDEDDDEDDEDIPNSKFIPSWASKNHVALVVSSQQKIDPKSIFPPESFCNIDEVLLPRKLQQKF